MTTRRRARSPRGSGENLAEEIIEAAGELLVENGDDTAMSIRAVANRVGVTPPSIYLHFADKEALLDAVCARYFERLDDEMAAASEGVDDAFRRALNQGMAYVRFAVATPVLYRVAFGKPTSAGHPSKVDEVLAASAYSRFAGTVTELADEGVFDHAEIADIVLEFWAAAHGIASLMLAKPGLAWGDDFARAEAMLTAMCLGRASLATDGGIDQTAVGRRLRSLRDRVN
ncbi:MULTISPECIES: TetR/AcrR family transcriptional regulator [Gordonia]|uniref:TetR/AcrR family transcriptional regulator n=1 Tax=Gordonia TaxID=2053 RepID=UPI00071C80F8|nr:MULTISPECIES: TetR/AcrR family transcriptional regulator [Gordonia]MBR7190838.1 TetR/AcrR family transcriptional regulator [Gordonia sp. SCSIO 19800]MDT0220514.1 TetR/AcrR family transcriptional regulator [Gordonia sp. AC31]UPG69702.1 TetR/AcrR family transcriptional regulator [Gordonia hongkongensis]SCC02434.1 transcriptional regulator, TetR family [Gordonia sp. v-85]